MISMAASLPATSPPCTLLTISTIGLSDLARSDGRYTGGFDNVASTTSRPISVSVSLMTLIRSVVDSSWRTNSMSGP